MSRDLAAMLADMRDRIERGVTNPCLDSRTVADVLDRALAAEQRAEATGHELAEVYERLGLVAGAPLADKLQAVQDILDDHADRNGQFIEQMQRAEAAEAERDRMRAVVEAAGAFMPALHISPGDSGAMRGVWMRHGYDDAGLAIDLRAAIDAYRAGQPATSEAERIAAWIQSPRGKRDLGLQDADVVHAERYANAIRSGAWRKGQG